MAKIKSYIKNYLKEVNEDGFSLLELVVAVGVLLVLTVGGLLAYNGITKNARMAAVQSAADEVYTGAVAYESAGQGKDAQDAVDEWIDSAGSDSPITVSVSDESVDGFCITASMRDHSDISASSGAGCEGAPDGDGSGNENGGDGNENGDEDGPGVIETPATAAECFDFNAGIITGYDVDDCGTDVVIPNTIDNTPVVEIGQDAFYEKGLTSVVLNEGLETIGGDAFIGNNLTSVEFPSSLKTLGDNAFYDNELTSVVLNEGLETIGGDAFIGNNLTSVEFPSSLKTLGDNAFYDNELTSVVFNNGLEAIGNGAFIGNQLTSVEFPDSLKSIGGNAFSYNSLTSVKFNDGLESIAGGAFSGNQLTSVRISVNTTVDDYAFDYGIEPERY